MQVRRLTLKREVLQELSAHDLSLVGGAGPDTKTILETMYSCLAYESCHIVQCLVGPTSEILRAD